MENPDVVRQEVEEHHTSKIGDLPDGLVLVSSGSEDGADEEQEEGEIQDNDDDEEDIVLVGRAGPQLDLEDISSEEETNIRERMAMLEAMDKEVGMIKKISSRSAYDYLNDEDAVYGKENYLYYYQPKEQHRNSSNHKSTKCSVGKKQVHRHDSSKRGRVIPSKRHLLKTKEKEKTKRSSHKKHKRRKRAVFSSPSPQRRDDSSDSEPQETVDREYLKIACATEKGSKSGKHHASKNPLRDKLLLLTGRRRERGKTVAVPVIIDSSSSGLESDGEKDDELELRLLALNTKPKVKKTSLREFITDLQVPSPPPPPTITTLETDELPMVMSFDPESCHSEEAQLRMIALKSAILKKHASRLKRKERDAERPYSPSDDIVLTPVHEVPSAYDELDNELYSEGKVSVEIIDDDNDVLIVENPCEFISLDDTDEEAEVEEGGKDMDISSVESPTLAVTAHDNSCFPNDLTEDSQQPIDMDLGSSEHSSEPFSESIQNETRPNSTLCNRNDSCDADLFTRREKRAPQSPPLTPDSMEEAEADALRHLLLTKMRQKQSQKSKEDNILDVPIVSEAMVTSDPLRCNETILPVYMREESANPLPQESSMRFAELKEVEVHLANSENHKQMAPLIANSNLITLINRTGTGRKRRKKSQSIKTSTVESGTTSSPLAGKVLAIAELPSASHPDPLKASMVRTQKIVNNPNKLINLNQTISPSPPLLRTASPNHLTNGDAFISKPVAKLVIEVGNSDSDSDVDFGSPSSDENGTVPLTKSTPIPTVHFEEQLDKFLKSVRSKTNVAPDNGEDNTKANCDHAGTSSPPKTFTAKQPNGAVRKSLSASITGHITAPSTAVKHLPKSAQMEYMRLVARMAQLEHHKQMRQRCSVLENPTVTGQAVTMDPSKTSSSEMNLPGGSPSREELDITSKGLAAGELMATKSPGRRKHSLSESQSTKAPPAADVTTIVQDPMDRKLQQIRSSIPNLSEPSRNRLLLTAEKQLAKHSGTFLEELQQHNKTIISAQQERRELYQIDSRIELLKEKLRILERAREQLRHRSVETFNNLQGSHRKILASRKRASELERMCNEIGHKIVGEEYQLPTSSNDLVLQGQLRMLATETRQLRAMRKPTLDEFKEQIMANHRRKLVELAEGGVPENDSCPKEVAFPLSDRNKTEAEKSPEEQQTSCESITTSVVVTDIVQQDKKAGEAPVLGTEDNPGDILVESVVKITEKPISFEEHQSEPTTSDVQSAKDISIGSPMHENSQQNQREAIPPVEKPTSTQDTALEQEIHNPVLSEGVDEPQTTPNEMIPFGKYTSPLLSLKQGVQHIPTGVLCPYDLGGQCVDHELLCGANLLLPIR